MKHNPICLIWANLGSLDHKKAKKLKSSQTGILFDPTESPNIILLQNSIFLVHVVSIARKKYFRDNWASLGAEMIIFKACDQMAPRLAAVTQMDYFQSDLVSEYPTNSVYVKQSGKLRFRANLGSLDPKGEFKMEIESNLDLK